ncbi:MAG: TetM/TetW/TetO/TetS family tetracycline resistance ribosomal protection protein [Micropruina sp.]|uniref:GTP-binding protein n=1 Tax=Micropruina sp. TaxID=2737536 RepID=UPI0039E43802
MHFLNLGILAHVDAGKTSLTERLLFESGTIGSLGRVDLGTTRTDSMELERRRGITIRTNVAAFVRGGVQVNLIDTPGHSDFIAEVERSLAVLDAAILVVSAVEGVQPQTVVLWRALRRLDVPTLVFVNKIDRPGADSSRVVAEVRRRLAGTAGPDVVMLSRTDAEGRPDAAVEAVPLASDAVIEVLTRHDDDVLADAVNERRLTQRRLATLTRTLVGRGVLVPVLAGSALTGAGVRELLDGLSRLFAWARPAAAESSALVFKIDHDGGRRTAWVRVFAGEVALRQGVSVAGERPRRITALRRAAPEGFVSATCVGAGEVAAVQGPDALRIGDWIGTPIAGRVTREFPPPGLEAIVEPVDPSRRGALNRALSELAQSDPLINLRVDPDRGELAVSLYGEVQKEVIGSLLAEQFDVPTRFSDTTIVHVERVLGSGAAVQLITERFTQYLATLGVRVESAPPGAGLVRRLEAELGSMPPAFFEAAWEGVRTGLAQGRHGWAIPDAVVTITHTGYYPRQSHAHQTFNKNMSTVGADFRNLAPMLVHQALAQAGTAVCEPIERFTLDIPASALAAVTATLGQSEGRIADTAQHDDRLVLSGTLPTRRLLEFSRGLPDLTRGEGVLQIEIDHDQPVIGTPPVRRRIGPDPLDGEVWCRERPR